MKGEQRAVKTKRDKNGEKNNKCTLTSCYGKRISRSSEVNANSMANTLVLAQQSTTQYTRKQTQSTRAKEAFVRKWKKNVCTIYLKWHFYVYVSVGEVPGAAAHSLTSTKTVWQKLTRHSLWPWPHDWMALSSPSSSYASFIIHNNDNGSSTNL